MTTPELNDLLQELYRLEPELREHETELRQLLSRMSELKPDTRFDRAFAARLKAEILAETTQAAAAPLKNNSFLFNFNLMNKKIYLAVGSLAVVAIVIIAATTMYRPGQSGLSRQDADAVISELPSNAFGNLAYLSPTNTGNANATPEIGSVASMDAPSAMPLTAPLGMGGDTAVSSGRTQSGGGSGNNLAVGVSMDAKMIVPYYSYKYVYKGEALELTDETGSVYRRLKGDGQSGRSLASLVSGLNLPEVDLKSFSNLRATNLSLVEDKDQGLMVSFDFNEDNIYISENWEKWRIPERENCSDQACWDSLRLRPSDVPADDQLIAKADRFLSDHQISREHYGEPQVDNNWRVLYAQMTSPADFYIPEYATVVYPLLLNGEPVRDQSGSYSGLRVTINLLKNAASGVNGLSPYRYESSSYQLETAADSIIQVAENGGYNRGWYGDSTNIQTLELGTPERSYVQLWRYTNNKNEELLVPALIFPILNAPQDMYYGQRTVIVPLVKELLDELNKQSQSMPLPVDGGLPVIMSDPAGAAESQSSPAEPSLR